MSRFWSDNVTGLDPYVPGEQPVINDIIKLNTNENPYPPSPNVIDALKSYDFSCLTRYPNPESDRLLDTLADYHKVDKNNVFVGNGSDEVLAHAFNAFFQKKTPILFPDITYSFYPVYSKLYTVEYELCSLTESFEVNLQDYIDKASRQPIGGIIFPNPNAPTGILTSLDNIKLLLDSLPDVPVIIDEAYIDFVNVESVDKHASALSLISKYDNLLVVRTLSKSRALAGLRVGYAIGSAELIDGLRRVKNSFNSYPVDCLAEVAAIASFEDEIYFQDKRKRVIFERERLTKTLEQKGFIVLPSEANFMMVTHPDLNMEELALKLRDQSIIVRYFNKPRINNFLRISIGLPEENNKLIDIIFQ